MAVGLDVVTLYTQYFLVFLLALMINSHGYVFVDVY